MPSTYYPYMSRAKEAKKQKQIITPDLRLVFHRTSKTKRTKLILQPQPPPQALRFSHGRGERETRVTGDEPQGTMGRVQTTGEAFRAEKRSAQASAHPLSQAQGGNFLCVHCACLLLTVDCTYP